jgi:outer membrane protein OmpA-like peptidoglycan-associated protein
LTGHTDNSDTDDFNLQLGERRSNLLKNYMVEMGLPSNRIITQSVGEAQPAYPNTIEEGRMRNRRVVIRTVNKSTTPAAQH